ncbi:HNH endonuclease signature motif containing protein [Nocardioides stalactiti]|uniref:HNH endonuclease signature motif containing protein n=1 Tax=Nocardioides stalactiti TaxID=2755356 RepID=UPI0016048666|nr:HNH endonuclease signature motif containing protein [Nocardioides stalactiti]
MVHPSHPVVACAEAVSAAVAEVAGVQPVFMTTSDKSAALLALTDAERRLAELRLRVIAASGDLADVDGCRDVAAWLTLRTQADGREARPEEKLAREKCRLSLRALGDGTARLTALLTDAVGARLLTYLEAFTSPRKQRGALGSEVDRIPYFRQLGQAFRSLLEHLDPARLPAHGGDATTVLVTIGLEKLRQDLATAGLLDGDLSAGDNLSAEQARRLACTAKIIPVVLGGRGEILDLGRARRLFNPAQRKAMALRDRHCRAEGCTVPAAWCEAHHDHPWSQGGRTDLDDGRLYCSWHHHRAHDPRFTADHLPNGDTRFHRRR